MSARFQWIAVSLVAALGACRQNNPIIVPNRVLDRPLDVVLSCISSDGESVTVLSLDQCNGAGVGSCDRETPQLIGFVANNEKNEIGMFRQCDQNGMVDLDPETPGYNLVPVGAQPSRIVASEDCRIVTANVGSCDLSAVELPGLAAYAVGLRPDEAPSALVTRIVPVRGDGTLLGAAPGDLIAVPRELSLAQSGAAPSEAVGECDPDAPASVYVTFPACQLVAEIDLGSQRILQSRQFVTDSDGAISVIDTGPDPNCPLECPAQFDTVPQDRPDVSENGLFPGALALVQPGTPDPDFIDEDSRITYPTLFVGGTGSDEIFEIRLSSEASNDDTVGFAAPADIHRLELENASGVQVIRVTPVTEIEDTLEDFHQFLYVVAGDGSTHVVRRDLQGNELGVECDTQVDPALALSSACHPIDPGSQTSAAERRPFASGPGIRDTFGATITDWAFQRYRGPEAGADQSRSPFGRRGTVGIGVTSFGRIVLGVFGQYDDAEPTISRENVDPIGLLNVEIRPHMLWPVIDPETGDPSVFPLVDDEEPRRVLPSEDNPTQVLAPALRRIDLAYSAELVSDSEGDVEGEFSEDQLRRAQLLGNPDNVDQMGGTDERFYENPVVRAVVRDYRQWRGQQTWRLLWEGAVPGTESATGRIECDAAPEVDLAEDEAPVCRATATEPVRLVDEGATFCDEGVLAGDKLVIFGCGTDDECGLGRRCLRDPSSGGATSGICVSALSYADHFEALQQACAPFISDPCGTPRREYVITRATQTELTFGATDIPSSTFVRAECPVPAGQDNLLDPLGPKPEPEPAPDPAPLDDENIPLLRECEARLTCALPQGEGIEAPSGGCSSDADCAGLGGTTGAQYLCIEGACRTPCEGGSLNCRQMVLPGPRCFAEFVRYAVTLRESFQVAVSDAANFITDQVRSDPDTGECSIDPTVSTLLTSRLPLGRDEAVVLEEIPACPSSEDASPSDPNPCVITESRLATDGDSVYHLFQYARDARVQAIRFSNPFGTIVLDLVSLIDLATPTTAILADGASVSELLWPKSFARFKRARIPRNYREEFTTPPQTGYQAYNDPVVVQSTPLTYPVRIVPAPEFEAAYIVDAGGRGGVAGVRGQVMRITISDSQILADDQFRVR